MKRSPLQLSRMPPSPRTPSVIRTPAPATPVGWNCQNSMSSRGMLARAAMPRPSPVLMKALVEAAKIRPAPPVANTVALACRIMTSPVSISSATTPSTGAVGIAHQVEGHPLDEELRVGADVALVERVQHRVTGAVGRRARALHRLLAEVRRVPAERALVDRAVGVAVERHAEVLELVDHLRRHAAHGLDRVLVAEPVRALDRVVHVPEPAVLAHVAERGADPALCGHRVRAGREHLRQHRNGQSCLRQRERGTHARAARADDDRVEAAHRKRIHRATSPRLVAAGRRTPPPRRGGRAPWGRGLLALSRPAQADVSASWRRLAVAVDPHCVGPLAGCSRRCPLALIARPKARRLSIRDNRPAR